jgi:hypothetical protein
MCWVRGRGQDTGGGEDDLARAPVDGDVDASPGLERDVLVCVVGEIAPRSLGHTASETTATRAPTIAPTSPFLRSSLANTRERKEALLLSFREFMDGSSWW